MEKRDLNLVLTKIMEECGEVIQICSKCIFYGLDNTSPKDGNIKTNRDKLIEEIGDVFANIQVLVEDTDSGIISDDFVERAAFKYSKLEHYLPKAK